jgi:NDP-sugar pyrophosphorylase family protein
MSPVGANERVCSRAPRRSLLRRTSNNAIWQTTVKVVILAGGLGTRLAEETDLRPKPMVEIGGMPILWHIMKHYAHYGFKEFYIALGYRGDVVKLFFLDYCQLSGNLTVELTAGRVRSHTPRLRTGSFT